MHPVVCNAIAMVSAIKAQALTSYSLQYPINLLTYIYVTYVIAAIKYVV